VGATLVLIWLVSGQGTLWLSLAALTRLRWLDLTIAVILAASLLVRYSRLVLPRSEGIASQGPSAVKGAEAFGIHDARLFAKLGRGDDLRVLMGHVLDDQKPLTIVMGSSGVGKSSLLRAGLEASLLAASPPTRVTYWEAVP